MRTLSCSTALRPLLAWLTGLWCACRYDDIKHEKLFDNSYETHSSLTGESYGGKAAEVLIKTQGKSFRHEKTKKKRGTYRGGQISMASNSIKFED